MYASYYTLFLIPAGIGLFVLIKFCSDSGASNRAISISGDDHAQASINRIGPEALLSAIDATCKKNDVCFIIKGLPVREEEVALQAFRTPASRSMTFSANEKSGLKGYIELNGLAWMCGDMFCANSLDDYRNLFAARMTYDIFIKEGAFRIGKKRDIAHFLNENSIITSEGLDYGRLSKSEYNKPLTVFRLCPRERKAMSAAELICSKGNSLLLMLSASGLVRVLDC